MHRSQTKNGWTHLALWLLQPDAVEEKLRHSTVIEGRVIERTIDAPNWGRVGFSAPLFEKTRLSCALQLQELPSRGHPLNVLKF